MENVIYRQNVICYDSITESNHSHDTYYPAPWTVCPTENLNHTFLTTYIVSKISSNQTTIINETDNTEGGYHAEGFNFDVPAGPSTEFVNVGSFVFPYNIRLECASLGLEPENYGDFIASSLVPPTPIALVSNAVSSGNVITISTVAYIRIDMTITLVQGATVQNIGNVIAINSTNFTITVTENVSESFTPGAYVTAVLNYVKNIALKQNMKRTFGDSIEGNVLIPANSTIVIKYKNTTASSKSLGMMLEYFA